MLAAVAGNFDRVQRWGYFGFTPSTIARLALVTSGAGYEIACPFVLRANELATDRRADAGRHILAPLIFGSATRSER